MAEIVGCLALSHAPQLMLEPDLWGRLPTREAERLPVRPELTTLALETKRAQWEHCHATIARQRGLLAAYAPDTVVIVGDDQHENLVDDNMPPFLVFLGDEVEASTSMRVRGDSLADNRARYRVDAALARWALDGLMARGFDPAYARKTRFEGGLGHAFARPLRWLLPEAERAIVPVMVNTYYPPAPSAQRCLQFGAALGAALRAFREPRRIVLVASGGLSHTKVDEALDREVMAALARRDLDALARLPEAALVEGTSEIKNWLVVAAAAEGAGAMLEYLPLYRADTGVGCAMGFAQWVENGAPA